MDNAPTYVLRKTCRKFSAGTRVVVTNEIAVTLGCEVIEATYTHVDYYTDYAFRRQERRTEIIETFEVPSHYLVKLRNKVDEVPAIPRIKRDNRVARQRLHELIMNRVLDQVNV